MTPLKKVRPTQAKGWLEWGTAEIDRNYSCCDTNTAVVRAGTVTVPALLS